MNYFDAIILGIVEGVTEFLPISSTGHLVLAAKLLNLGGGEFIKTFEISIQLGAILSVVVLYWSRVIRNLEIWKRVIVAFLPTGLIGFALYKVIKELVGSQSVVLWSMFVGGILLILFELYYQKKNPAVVHDELESLPYGKCVVLGLCQSVAMVPGVSRAAATVVGGLAMGISRRTIVEFSFLLAVPTMLMATIYDIWKNAPAFSGSQFGLLGIGFLMSFLVAIVAIKFLIGYVKNHTFIGFGLYRIVAALLFWFFILR